MLGKLSFVTACVHASRIFLSRLLNTLRSFSSNTKSQLVMLEMPHDLAWWQTFHPLYNGVCVIKPADWSFADFRFTTDACLTRGRATCLDKCLTFPFLDFVIHAASHICALELFPVIVAVKFWTTGRIATSAISRLLRQRGGGYRDQFGLHQRSFHAALFGPVVVHLSAS